MPLSATSCPTSRCAISLSISHTPATISNKTRGRGGLQVRGRHDPALLAWASYVRPLGEAFLSSQVRVAGMRIRIPGPPSVRASVVAGNVRVHALVDAVVAPGSLVVDVGAHIGYNTLYAAARVGPRGRVIAVEPALDNLEVLFENLSVNHLDHVVVHALAAGRTRETRELFERGETSAVNSLFPDSCYAAVTHVSRVPVAPLDDFVDGDPALVKIDVEGAELEVLAGMRRLLGHPAIRLVVEWHPTLQRLAGHPATALPEALLEAGFTVDAVSHFGSAPLAIRDLRVFADRLVGRRSRPVELYARR